MIYYGVPHLELELPSRGHGIQWAADICRAFCVSANAASQSRVGSRQPSPTGFGYRNPSVPRGSLAFHTQTFIIIGVPSTLTETGCAS